MGNAKQEIGTRLREIRTKNGLTQAQLADLVSVSRQTINYIEMGTYCPSTKLALQLATALRVQVEEMFFLSENGNSSNHK